MSVQVEVQHVGKGALEAAIAYLKGSSTAREIISGIEAEKGALLVVATMSKAYTGHGVMFASSLYAPPARLSASEREKFPLGVVHWWVLDWTKVSKDEYQTPAMALMHEMGHAWQYLKVPKFTAAFDKAPSKKKIAQIEADNLIRCETPVAKELSVWAPREAVRKNYAGNLPLSEQECQKLGIPEYNKPVSLASPKAPRQQETYRHPW